ncbi:hypothetical protein GCM10022217_26360 [Chryseobacterium ginsenosidimutans]
MKWESLEMKVLLRYCKLLKYMLCQRVERVAIIYKTNLNIYTNELMDFILELINDEKKIKAQMINEYRIPKTILYKWIKKYKI